MNIPWVARSTMDMLIDLLKGQLARAHEEIAELKKEQRTLLDYLASGQQGTPIYNKPAPVVTSTADDEEDEKPLADPVMKTAIQEAMELVGNNPRKVQRFVQAKFQEERQKTDQDMAAVVAEFNRAQEEGRLRASKVS